MKHINYTTYPSKAIEICEVLKEIGIDFTTRFIPSSVPCCTKTIINIAPKTQLEACAAFGVIG